MYFTIDELVKINEGDKQLIDANKIPPTNKCIAPSRGDLVRIRFSGHESIAVCGVYHDVGRIYYTTQLGEMLHRDDVKVLEIIGKCVFGVYK